jgi:hypothetical protein
MSLQSIRKWFWAKVSKVACYLSNKAWKKTDRK